MKPLDVYQLLEPLHVGDVVPDTLTVHGERWTVVERREHPAILILMLEAREFPAHMFYGYPKCWVATNMHKSVLSAMYADDLPNRAMDLVHQQKHTQTR